MVKIESEKNGIKRTDYTADESRQKTESELKGRGWAVKTATKTSEKVEEKNGRGK